MHDVVEDGGGPEAQVEIAERFGVRVARIVAANSDTDEEPKPPWRQRKQRYIESIAYKQPDELLISLADKLYNARAILFDLRVEGDEIWDRFKANSGPSVRWYYRSLVEAFDARRPDLTPRMAGALEELRRVVEEIERAELGVDGRRPPAPTRGPARPGARRPDRGSCPPRPRRAPRPPARARR